MYPKRRFFPPPPPGLPTKNLICVYCFSVLVSCPVHLILLDLIALAILGRAVSSDVLMAASIETTFFCVETLCSLVDNANISRHHATSVFRIDFFVSTKIWVRGS
jgi:hypothetical protein